MMDSSNKMTIGYGIVLTVSVLVGVWLYVDGVKSGLEMRIDNLAAEVRAMKAQNMAK